MRSLSEGLFCVGVRERDDDGGDGEARIVTMGSFAPSFRTFRRTIVPACVNIPKR
jgi:hypothetical protein